MNTTNHDVEMPLTKTAPSSLNGHSPGGLEGSRGIDANTQLAQENAKLAQENARLQQKYDLLRTLIDSLPDRIFIKDRQSRFLVNNLTHVQVMGATGQDEVLGKTDLDIFPAEYARHYYADDQALMESGQPLDREEMTVNLKTNRTHWLQTTKVPLRDKQGTVVGLMGISRDITDRKQAEEALARERLLLRTLIDSLPDAIFAKDSAGRKTMANPADLKISSARPKLRPWAKPISISFQRTWPISSGLTT